MWKKKPGTDGNRDNAKDDLINLLNLNILSNAKKFVNAFSLLVIFKVMYERLGYFIGKLVLEISLTINSTLYNISPIGS